jgi:hypothetical protein
VSGDVLDLWESFPEEVIRFQFTQLVKRTADIPQGIETLSIGCTSFQLCLKNAQLTFERFTLLPDLLNLRV